MFVFYRCCFDDILFVQLLFLSYILVCSCARLSILQSRDSRVQICTGAILNICGFVKLPTCTLYNKWVAGLNFYSSDSEHMWFVEV